MTVMRIDYNITAAMPDRQALQPDVLTDILRIAIEQRTDRRAFERVLRQERVARRNLLRQIPTSFARHAP